MSDGPWSVVVEPIGNSHFGQGPHGAFLAQPETADAICRMLNAVFAAGAASQADRVKALEEALRDLLEDYDSIKFSCGNHNSPSA